METPNWVLDASCRGLHTDLWFPPVDHENPQLYYQVGATVCASCPVWRECIKAGAKETYGMWGGLTPAERSAYINKTEKHLASHGTFQRFRQGCNCADCASEQTKQFEKPFKKSLYPNTGKPLVNIEQVHSGLFSPPNDVK